MYAKYFQYLYPLSFPFFAFPLERQKISEMVKDVPHTGNENMEKVLANLDLKIGSYNIRRQGAQNQVKLKNEKKNSKGKFDI